MDFPSYCLIWRIAGVQVEGSACEGKPSVLRIVGIDLTRSFAICAAMLSHIWVVAEMDKFHSGPFIDVLRVIMALATPTFILLFGTMLEIIYRPRFTDGQRGAISARLISRAVQCWILYCLSVVVLFATSSNYSLKFSVATMMLLGVTPFTDILKFYAVALALAPLLLWLRTWCGLMPLALAAMLIHACYPLLRAIISPVDAGLGMEADRLAMFLFGIGHARLGGPSILHGASLVIAGMCFGALMTRAYDEPHKRSSRLLLWVLASVALGLAIAAPFIINDGMRQLGDMSMRMDSHPLYFAEGVCGAVGLTTIAVLATQSLPPEKKKSMEALTFLGRTSLFTFSFGNIILYCVWAEPASAKTALALTVTLMLLVIGMSFWFDRSIRHDGPIKSIVTSIQTAVHATVASVVRIGARRTQL